MYKWCFADSRTSLIPPLSGKFNKLPHSLLKYFFIPSLCKSPQYDDIYCTVSTFNEMINRFDGNLSKFNSDSIIGLLTKGMPVSQIENSVNQLLID